MSIAVLGFEWVKPTEYWCGDRGDYSGAVSIQANIGPLLLARIEQSSDGFITRVLVKPEEITCYSAGHRP